MNPVVPQSTFKRVYDYSSGFRCTLMTTIVILSLAAIAGIILSVVDCSCYSDSICGALIACIFVFYGIIVLIIVAVGFAIAAAITYCNASSQLNNI